MSSAQQRLINAGGLQTRLQLSNDTVHLQRVRSFVAEGVQQGGFAPHLLNQIQVAVEEAVTNIIEHAYHGITPGAGQIELVQVVSDKAYCIQIEDNGASFDPRNSTLPEIKAHFAQGHSGGLGVFLLRRIMDVVDYNYEQNVRNRLILIKHSPPAPA